MQVKNCLLCSYCRMADTARGSDPGVYPGHIICDMFGLCPSDKAGSCRKYTESDFLRCLQTDLSDLEV